MTLEGHQRAIMGALTVDEIFKDRKKFAEQVFDCASTDLFNMGIQVLGRGGALDDKPARPLTLLFVSESKKLSSDPFLDLVFL